MADRPRWFRTWAAATLLLVVSGATFGCSALRRGNGGSSTGGLLGFGSVGDSKVVSDLLPTGPAAEVNGTTIPLDAFREELERTAGDRALELLIREALAKQRAPGLGVKVDDAEVEKRVQALKGRDPTLKLQYEGFMVSDDILRRHVRRTLLEEKLAVSLAQAQGRYDEPLQLIELMAALREGLTVTVADSRFQYLETQAEPVKWTFDPQLDSREIPAGVVLPKDPAAALNQAKGAAVPDKPLPPISALRSFAYAMINYDYVAGLAGINQVPRTLREQFFYGRSRPGPGAALREGTFSVLSKPTPASYSVMCTLTYVEGGVPRQLKVQVRMELLDFAGIPMWKVLKAEPR